MTLVGYEIIEKGEKKHLDKLKCPICSAVIVRAGISQHNKSKTHNKAINKKGYDEVLETVKKMIEDLKKEKN